MGVLPLQFPEGLNRKSLDLDGSELVSVDVDDNLAPQSKVKVTIDKNGQQESFEALCRIDTANELEYYRHGGILQYVLRQMKG